MGKHAARHLFDTVLTIGLGDAELEFPAIVEFGFMPYQRRRQDEPDGGAVTIYGVECRGADGRWHGAPAWLVTMVEGSAALHDQLRRHAVG